MCYHLQQRQNKKISFVDINGLISNYMHGRWTPAEEYAREYA